MSARYESKPATVAPSSPSSTAPRRIACDRCHGQKLKCPRDINGSAPCTRCAKAGAVCQVSPARATGRPPKHPKPQHRKSESSASSCSSRPSLTDSISTADDDIPMPPIMQRMSTDSRGSLSLSDGYMQSPAMPCLPIMGDTNKFYPSPEMQFDFADPMNPTYMNMLNFEYDNGTNYMNFTPSGHPMMTSPYSKDPTLSMGITGMTPQYGPMTFPPTPSMSLPEEMYDSSSVNDDFRAMESLSRSSSFIHGLDMNHDNRSRQSLSRPSCSPDKCGFSEASLNTMKFPHGIVSQEDLSSKKRRHSKLGMCTPEHEQSWHPSLGLSSIVASIQTELDNFSKSLMSQSFELSQGTRMQSSIVVDVGILIPIADKFASLIPQFCQPSSPVRLTQKARGNSYKSSPKQTHVPSPAELSPSAMEDVMTESQNLDSDPIQMMFTCLSRLHFAISIALDIMSHNLSLGVTMSSPDQVPQTSIGSYKIPTSSPLSTLLHLHAISHSLDRLGAMLQKYIGSDYMHGAGFFEGIYGKPKRNEAAVHTSIEHAFEEACERKEDLMARIREIVAQVAGNEK